MRCVRPRWVDDSSGYEVGQELKADVFSAGELPGSSPLRRVFEAAPDAAAIGCYPDTPRERGAVIADALRAHRITASIDAAEYLVEHLGNDRLVTRSELEKLVLYAGAGGRFRATSAHFGATHS